MKAHKKNRSENDESYFISMTDIMVGLLFIFILIIMYFSFQLKIQTEAKESYAQTAIDHRANILINIREHLKKEGINVKIDTEQGILRLPEGVLFASGIAEIKAGTRAKVVSQKLATIFTDVLKCSVFNLKNKPFDTSSECKEQNESFVFLESIFIEGHTDDVRVSVNGLQGDRNLTSNLRLSARRATNTYNTMLVNRPILEKYRSPLKQAIFAVSAYGKTRPIDDNKNTLGRANNRRIDIRLLMFVPGTSAAVLDFKKKIGTLYANN
jgi:flagellar motor protein MotB